MKKAAKISRLVLVLFFIVLLIFNSGGYWAIFHIQKNSIKKEIKRKMLQKIPIEELTCLSFKSKTAEQIFWIEDNEFYYNGNMYDVVRTVRNKQGQITYYCINDTKEANLKNTLAIYIDRHMKDDIPKNNRQNFISKIIKEYTLQTSLLYSHSTVIILEFTNCSTSIKNGFYRLLIQPPEKV